MSAHALHPGDRVADRYLIVDHLAQGGFGEVYLAVQESVQRYVALKTLRLEPDPFLAARRAHAFRREALHTSRLQHPNTITLFDYGEVRGGVFFLVTELLEGESLGRLMERNQRFTPSLTLHLMKQVASSLAEAHEIGIVHGDLKPDNVFVCQPTPWSEPWFVKVLDFGLARLIGDANPAGLGTPQYMAPEQFSGDPLLPASDIYAAGLMIAELLLGARAFGAPSQRLQRLLSGRAVSAPPLPPLLESMGWGTVLRRALDPDPNARIPDGAALLATLRALETATQHMGEDTWHGPPSVSSMAPEHPTLGWEGSASAQTAISSSSSLPALRETDTIEGPLAARRARHDPHALARLVGRAAERAELRRALEALTHDRQGLLLVLCGERGSGKSLLTTWALAQARELGLRCGESSCARDRCGVVDALGDALGVSQAPDGSFHMRALEDGAARHLRRELRPEETVTLMAAFGWYTERDQRRLLNGLCALLCALAQASPLLLALHNLERATPQTLAALEHLADALQRQPAPLLVLTNVSRELLPEHPPVAHTLLTLQERPCVRFLQLPPLEEAALASLARAALSGALDLHEVQGEPGAALLGALTAAAYGNPLALQELAEELVARDLITLTSGGLALKPSVDPRRLQPPALSRFLEDRALARLAQPPATRGRLQALLLRCALLGPSFPQALLVNLLEREARSGHRCAQQLLDALATWLQRLLREDLLVQEPPGAEGLSWSFAQPQMWRALRLRADSLPDAPPLHALVADAMTALYGSGGAHGLYLRRITEHRELATRHGASSSPAGWEPHRTCWRLS